MSRRADAWCSARTIRSRASTQWASPRRRRYWSTWCSRSPRATNDDVSRSDHLSARHAVASREHPVAMHFEHASFWSSVVNFWHELQALAQLPLQTHWYRLANSPKDAGHTVSGAGGTPPEMNFAQWLQSHFWRRLQV